MNSSQSQVETKSKPSEYDWSHATSGERVATLARAACGFSSVAARSTAVRVVTEGRLAYAMTHRQAYSGCGDLAHWALYAAGCREPWINRGKNYRIGRNINRLVGPPVGVCPLATVPSGDDLQTGDVVVVNVGQVVAGIDRSHVVILLDRLRQVAGAVTFETAEYGQGTSIQGAIKQKTFNVGQRAPLYGGRPVWSVRPTLCPMAAAPVALDEALEALGVAWPSP